MKNRILYLHGFRSSPASFKGRMMEQALAERGLSHIWAAPQLPASPKAAIDLALGLAQAQLKEDDGPGNDASRLTVIGSSLGGYYATWLAEKLGCKAILLNPAVHAASKCTPALVQRCTEPIQVPAFKAGACWMMKNAAESSQTRAKNAARARKKFRLDLACGGGS